MNLYKNRAIQARYWVVATVFLMAAITVFNTLIAPAGQRQPSWVVCVALLLPLLIMLPGILRARISSFAWLGFISLLYFAQAVIAVMSSAPRLIDWLHLLDSIALFVGALLFVRWRARASRVDLQ